MELTELCKLIGIQREVQKKVLELSKYLNFKSMEQEIEQIKHPKFWEGAIEHIQTLLGDDEDGMKILTCQLQCACDCYTKYENIGISKEIFIATMKIFQRFLQDYKDRHGSYQYVWAWWTVRQISMTIYRIGELEYEMKMENEKYLMDIHIPADADMNTDKLRDSYLKALDFFRSIILITKEQL